MSGVRPPDSLSDDQIQFWKELVNRISTSIADGSARQPPAGLSPEQRTYWKELVNRVHAVSVHANSTGPLSMVPGVPNRPSRVTRDMLEDIARWKLNQLARRPGAAVKVSFGADWNPSLHPRGPDGKFVERPWSGDIFPDDLNVNDATTSELVEFLGDAPGDPDMDRILSDDDIRIDGVPDDVNTVDDLKSRIQSPQSDADVPTNPKDFGELNEGDVFRGPEGPLEVLNKGSDGATVEVRTPDGGRSTFSFNEQDRSTVDVYDVEAMDDLPSQQTSTLSTINPDDERFTEPDDFGDAVVEGAIIKYRDRWEDEVKVGRVVEKSRGFGDKPDKLEVKPKDSDRTVPMRVDPDWGDGDTHEVTGEILERDDDGGGGELTLDDVTTNDARFVEDPDVTTVDEGDIVRVETEGGRPKYEVARVTDKRFEGAEFTVQTKDGETLELDINSPDDLDAVLRTSDEDDGLDLSPEEWPTEDDRGTVDLTELDGTPQERREAVAGDFLSDDPITTSMVENEEIPEGAIIAGESGYGSLNVARVDGYTTKSFTDEKYLQVTTKRGSTRELKASRVEGKNYRPYKPSDTPTVTIPDDGWGDDDTALADRRRAVKSVLDDVLPTGEDSPDTNQDGPIDDDTFENAKDKTAQHLARANDKEHAENVIARLTSVGDDISRAHAVIGQSLFEADTAYYSISEDESTDTIVHELGHAVGDVYGFRGGSNDMDGETYPMPDFKWQSDDVLNKYAIKTPPDSDDFTEGESVSDQTAFMLDDWTDEVEEQVGEGLDGRNFSSVDDPNDLPNDEGSMIYLSEEPSRNEPRAWRVVDAEHTGTRFGVEEYDVTLEDRDGRQVSGTYKESFDEPAVRWDDDSPFIATTEVQGKRKSTPDNWRGEKPDPDDHLGTQSFDNPEDAMENLADKVNKSWYRQAVATREHGATRSVQDEYALKSGYSTKQAHETMSRIHELMRADDISNTEMAEAARTLVTTHPDLLEAYRNVYDIPVNMKVALNTVLELEDHDFRFDGVPSVPSIGDVDTVEDVVRDKYGGEA